MKLESIFDKTLRKIVGEDYNTKMKDNTFKSIQKCYFSALKSQEKKLKKN